MIKKSIVALWLLTLCNLFLLRFPPKPPSAVGLLFFQSLTVIATYLCGQSFFRRIITPADEDESSFLRTTGTLFRGLLAFLGLTITVMLAYASLTTSIAID